MASEPKLTKKRDEDQFGPSYQRIRWILNQCQRIKDYWAPEMERLQRMSRLYWGLDFGQWPVHVVDRIRSQGRRPPTFNITGWKIDTLVGSFMSNPIDCKILPATGKLDSLAMKAQDLYYSDKSHLSWDVSAYDCLRDCFVGVGYERMVISDIFNEWGNIAWEIADPLHTYIDTGWRTPYNRDIRYYFTETWMDPQAIREAFKTKASRLDDILEREKVEGVDYGVYEGAVQKWDTVQEKWNNKHRVVTYHCVKDETVDWEYDLVNRCNFPETGFKPGSKEDREAKTQYILTMGLQPTDITKTRRKMKTKYVEAIAPTLVADDFLLAGKDRVQTGNCNLYVLGNRYKDQFQGITDRMYDTQVSINKGEWDMDEAHAREARESYFVDSAVAGGDPERKAEIESNWNEAGAKIWLEEGSTRDLPGGGIVAVPRTGVGAEFVNHVQRRYQMGDMFSLVPAAFDARTQSQQETGVLYRHKVEMGLVGQKKYGESWKQHEKDKAEAFLRQIKITYAGVPREFASAGDGDPISINIPAIDANGNRVLIDDISTLPEMKVSFVPSSAGINLRTDIRQQYSETLATMTDPNDRLLKIILTVAQLETQEIPDEQKEELRKAGSLLKMDAAYDIALRVMAKKKMLEQAGEPPPDGGDAGPGQNVSAAPGGRALAVQGTPKDDELGGPMGGNELIKGGNFIEKNLKPEGVAS